MGQEGDAGSKAVLCEEGKELVYLEPECNGGGLLQGKRIEPGGNH